MSPLSLGVDLLRAQGLLGTAITTLKKWNKTKNDINQTATDYLNVKAMCLCPITDGDGFTGGRNDTTRAQCQEPGHPQAVCGPSGGGTWLPSDVAGDICIEKLELDNAGCFEIEDSYSFGGVTISTGDLNTTCANFLAWTNGLTVAACRRAEQYVPKALEMVRKLDIVADWITCDDPANPDSDSCALEGVWDAAMDICGTLENIKDVIDAIIKYINQFTDGYHLGAYGEVRSALHFCVPWRDKQLHFPNWVELPDDADDFSIGAKFRSFVISKKHQVHLQFGGFEARLFGKSIPLAPSLSMSGDLDMFRLLHKDYPFGIGAGGGNGNQYSAASLLGGTVTNLLAAVGTKQCYPVNWDEDPSNYYNDSATPATSPLTGANLFRDFNLAPWDPTANDEGMPVHTVLTAGVNLEWDFSKRWDIPKPPKPPFQIFPPFVTARIWIKLDYGFGWHAIANTMRDKIRDALNERMPDFADEIVPITAFDRNHETLQAPDVTNDRGNFVELGLALGLDINIGIDIGPIKIGVTVGISAFVNARPAADGGVLDLNAALVEVLQGANDRPYGTCDPVYSTTETFKCETAEPERTCDPTQGADTIAKVCGGLCRIPYAERPEDREFHANSAAECKRRYEELFKKNLVAQICPPSYAPPNDHWPAMSDAWDVPYPIPAQGNGAAVGVSTCPDANLAEALESGHCIAVGQGDPDFAHLLEGALIKCCPSERRRLQLMPNDVRDTLPPSALSPSTSPPMPYPTVSDLIKGKDDLQVSTRSPTPEECPDGGVRTYSSAVSMCHENCNREVSVLNPKTGETETVDRDWIDEYYFLSDACILNSSVTETVGWTGNGCSPLHTGFTSAVSCFLDNDCALGERCIGADISENSYGVCGIVPAAQPVDCPNSLWNHLHQIKTADEVTDCNITLVSGSCPAAAGRVCRDGAAAKMCSMIPRLIGGDLNEAAVTECSPDSRLTVCDMGACVPITSVYSESVYHGMETQTAPQHLISTYANIGMDLDLGLGVSIKIVFSIDLKFWKKEFTLFEWSDTFKPEWAPKYYYKLNTAVEHLYQNDTTIRDGGDFEPTSDLLDVCLDPNPGAGASNYDPDEVPSIDDGPPTNASDMADSLVDMHDFSLDILMAGWRSSQVCIDGQLLHEWQLENLPDPTFVTVDGVTTYTSASTDPNYPCRIFKGDGTTHSPLLGTGILDDFACDKLHVELPRFLGCLADTSYTGLCAYNPPFFWDDLGSDPICSGGEVNVYSMINDPAEGLVPTNFRMWFWTCPYRTSFLSALTSCIDTRGDQFHADMMASTAEPPVPRIEMGPRLDPNEVEGCCGDGTVSVFEECDPGSSGNNGGTTNSFILRVVDNRETPSFSLREVGQNEDQQGYYLPCLDPCATNYPNQPCHDPDVPCKTFVDTSVTTCHDLVRCYPGSTPPQDQYGEPHRCVVKKPQCQPDSAATGGELCFEEEPCDNGGSIAGPSSESNSNTSYCSETCELHCTGEGVVKICDPIRPHDTDWTEAMADLTQGRNCTCVQGSTDLWQSQPTCFDAALRACEGSWECGNCLPSLLGPPIQTDGGECVTIKTSWTSSGARDAFEALLACINLDDAPTVAPTPEDEPWPWNPPNWTSVPTPVPTLIPCGNNCSLWFDGCNICTCEPDGSVGACTKRFCLVQSQPYCLDEVPSMSPVAVPSAPPVLIVQKCLTKATIKTIFSDPGAPSDGMFKFSGFTTARNGNITASVLLDNNMENRQLIIAIRSGAIAAGALTPIAECDFNVASSPDLTIPSQCFVGDGTSADVATKATIFVGIGGYLACGTELGATGWNTRENGADWNSTLDVATPEFWRSGSIDVTQYLSDNELVVSYDLNLESFNALFKGFDGTNLNATVRYDLNTPIAEFCADDSGYPKTFAECSTITSLTDSTAEIPRIDEGDLLLRFKLTPADCLLLLAEPGTFLNVTGYNVLIGAVNVNWEFESYADNNGVDDRCVVLAKTDATLRVDTAVEFTFQVQGTSRRRLLQVEAAEMGSSVRSLQDQQADGTSAATQFNERSDTFYFVVNINTDVETSQPSNDGANDKQGLSTETMVVIAVVTASCAAVAIAFMYRPRRMAVHNRVHDATSSGVVTAATLVQDGAGADKRDDDAGYTSVVNIQQ